MLKMEKSSNFVMWVLVKQCRFRFSRWNVEECVKLEKCGSLFALNVVPVCVDWGEGGV